MMDALAQLALMSKAKLVFETPGTFLSFPALSPTSYKTSELKVDPATITPAQVLALSQFSRLANSRPAGTIFPMMDEAYLWDIYQDILNSAILARDMAKAEDTAAFNAAVALLTTTDANGLVTDSVQMSTYKQYRDGSIKATEDYKTQQLTAESSTDPVVQNQWSSTDEPRLRALKEQADAEWRSNGFKDQIEQALQVQQAHAVRSPATTWLQWSALFDPKIDLQTDSNQMQFALTSYAPQGIFDQDWPTFHLTQTEIAQLANQAPTELKDIFAIEGALSPVETLSFEYRSVALTRPWFRSGVFDARFWRLPDGHAAISDGADPPQGAWPAYAAALIFVRNITLTMKSNTPNQPTPTGPITADQVFMVDPALLRSSAVLTARPSVFLRPRIQQKTATMAQPMMTARDAGQRSEMVTARPNMILMRSAMTAAPQASNAALLSRLDASAFQVLPPANAPQPSPPPPPPTPVPNTTTQQGTRDEVSVLAYICKRIPKSPNPDSTLTW